MTAAESTTSTTFISTDALLEHWQGHRRLTRRVIEAFPEEHLFDYSIGGMRTFAELAAELLAIAGPMAQGLATGDWEEYSADNLDSKAELLRLWDEGTEEVSEFWSRIPPKRFAETVTAFGQFTGPVYWQVLYAIDNEIHHRGQGYVYLRALGIEPPAFYERE